jgi:hypothetical protein
MNKREYDQPITIVQVDICSTSADLYYKFHSAFDFFLSLISTKYNTTITYSLFKMYNQNNPPPKYVYYPQHQHSASPPPLQHPIPTHPPIQMRDPPSSPSPPTQQRMTHQPQHIPHQHPHQHPHQQHIQQVPAEYNMWNDATAQMGMQFGRSAMMAGSEYVEKNVNITLNIMHTVLNL